MQQLQYLIFILLFINIDSESGFGTDSYSILKYLPVIISIIGLIYFYVTRRKISREKNYRIKSIILILFLYLSIGSVFTLVNNGFAIEESFFGRAINVLPFFLTYIIVRHSSLNKIERFCSKVTKYHILFGLVYSFEIFYLLFSDQLFKEDSTKRPFHTQITLIIPTAVLIYFYFKNSLIRNSLIAFTVIAGLVIWKNTSFLSLLVTGLFSYLYFMRKRHYSKGVTLLLTISVIIISSIAVIFSFSLIEDILPGGGSTVRLSTYYQRWGEFLSSPVYGKFFIGSPLIEFGWIIIPSHSDVLDILAFGGMIGLLLFLYPLINLYKNSIRILQNNLLPFTKSYVFYSIVANVSWLITIAFNPVLGKPRMAYFFWFGLAFVFGLINNKEYRNTYLIIRVV